MKHPRHIISLAFACLLFCLLNAAAARAQCCELFLAFGDKAAASHPFSQVLDPTFHPAVQAGAARFYKRGDRHALFQTAEVNAFHHDIIGYGLGIRSQAGYRYTFPFRLYPEFLLGLGYLGVLPTERQFQLEDGVYVGRRPVFSRFEVMCSLGLGYAFRDGMGLFLRYQYAVMMPYNRSIGLIPTEQLMIGFKFAILKAS